MTHHGDRDSASIGADVGVSAVISVAEHQDRVLATIHPLRAVTVPLSEASQRSLAADVLALLDVPRFDNWAMDGHALRRADTAAKAPIALRVVADLPAGSTLDPALDPGDAARIMTGAPVPSSADRIAPSRTPLRERERCASASSWTAHRFPERRVPSATREGDALEHDVDHGCEFVQVTRPVYHDLGFMPRVVVRLTPAQRAHLMSAIRGQAQVQAGIDNVMEVNGLEPGRDRCQRGPRRSGDERILQEGGAHTRRTHGAVALNDPIHGEHGGRDTTPEIRMRVLAQLPVLARCGSHGAHPRPEGKFSHAIEHMLSAPDDRGSRP